jgi:methylenetetrahydrofolate dehydrogenase (NADP+)/methenyltetrahydrofolate cyclohydrolase
MAKILDGRSISAEIRRKLSGRIKELKEKHGMAPGVAFVMVGDDPDSKFYVGKKAITCEILEIRHFTKFLPEKTTEKELLALVRDLNADPKIHGIVVQLPLPAHISKDVVFSTISPEKDVDGLNPINAGNLLLGKEYPVPPAAKGIMTILDSYGISVRGKHAVICGMTELIGKPLFSLLLQRGAVVTACDSKAENISTYTKQAEILIVDIGERHAVRRDMVKEGAVVIDCGEHLSDGVRTGDVDFEDVKEIAYAITPVPGGVGPMILASLMSNLVEAIEKYHLKA